MAVLVGIDLGTTTTLVGRAVEEAGSISTSVVDIRQGDVELSYLPSVAYFPQNEDEDPLVGLEAQKRGPEEDATRYVRAVKRQMGRRVLLPVVEREPYQVSALYLEKALGEARYELPEVEDMVFTVTVPASFTTNQRADTLRALREACEQTGIRYPEEDEGELFISEPVAATLAFLNEEFEKPEAVRHLDLSESRRIVVYDIGGGTLDLTMVFVEPRGSGEVNGLADLKIYVNEIGYYNPFGGEDFDRALARLLYERLMEQFPELHDVHLSPEQRLGVRLKLMYRAKNIKENLSRQMQSADDLLFSDESKETTYYYNEEITIQGQRYSLEGEVSESEFKEAVKDFTAADMTGHQRKHLITPLEDLLTKSKLDPDRLDGLLIVGGAARLPLIPEVLREYWPNDQVWVFQPPDHAVVTGAAIYSYLRDRADFTLTEHAVDAYYVLLEDGFDLILPAKKDHGKRKRYKLDSNADRLSLQIFAGQQKDDSKEPVLSSLIHQGGTVIDLKKEYRKGTPVWVQMRYAGQTSEADHTKVPWVYVWVGSKQDPEQAPPQFRRRYSELV